MMLATHTRSMSLFGMLESVRSQVEISMDTHLLAEEYESHLGDLCGLSDGVHPQLRVVSAVGVGNSCGISRREVSPCHRSIDIFEEKHDSGKASLFDHATALLVLGAVISGQWLKDYRSTYHER